MRTIPFIAALIVLPAVVVALACAGCDRATNVPVAGSSAPAITVDELASSLAAVDLESVSEVQNAISNAANAERAIMFVHMDWAPMEPWRRRYAEFVIEYQKKHPNDNLLFHYIDCTPLTGNYAPLESLPGWAECGRARGSAQLVHGWGELVWMADGRVLDVQPKGFSSIVEMIHKTETLLPAADPERSK